MNNISQGSLSFFSVLLFSHWCRVFSLRVDLQRNQLGRQNNSDMHILAETLKNKLGLTICTS